MSHRKNCKSRSSDCIEHIKVKDLCVKNLNSKNSDISNSKVDNLNVENLNAVNGEIQNFVSNNAQLSGVNMTNFFRQPTAVVESVGFDCMDCNITPETPYGNPIKPDFLDQDVWDFLICNAKGYQQQLAEEFLEGREQIRCIKEAYGCTICPPDCPIPAGCPENCPEPPNCSVPPECIPDPFTCDPSVANYIYRTQTLRPYEFFEEVEGPKRLNFISNQSFSANINNTTCTLSPRVATVLFQVAYKGPAGPTGATGPCPICPGATGQEPLICACDPWTGPEINCGVLDVICKQFQATININLGENFSGRANVPSDLVYQIYLATKDVSGLLPAAVQMVIYLEDGLEVSTNRSRGGGSVDTGYTPTYYGG